MTVTIIEPLMVPQQMIDKKIELFKNLGINLKYFNSKPKNDEEIYERAKDSDVIIIANLPISDNILLNLNKTKYICVAFTGLDHINLDICKEKGIIVTNSAGYSDICVSELVVGHILNIYRHLNVFEKYMGYEIHGKTIGIVGLGNIGLKTARLLKAFGANIVYYDTNKNTDEFKKINLETLLEISDIVSIHIPYTKENENLFNYRNLSKMKKNSILINCARAKVINQEDLVKILEEDKIMACALDVFDIEPPLPENHIILNRKNAYLSAHIAYLTNESMIRRFEICMNNVIKYMQKGR